MKRKELKIYLVVSHNGRKEHYRAEAIPATSAEEAKEVIRKLRGPDVGLVFSEVRAIGTIGYIEVKP